MRSLKYIGVVLCVLVIIGTLPSVYLISKGLIVGRVDDPIYFAWKLAAYIFIIIALTVVSVKLFKSARG